MGLGIDLARQEAPELAAVLDDLKDQLLIAFVKRMGGTVIMPVEEVDSTGSVVMMMHVDDGKFYFETVSKQ